ncbi:MAG: PBP1A family penicillin-binding protein [Acidobacteria bacterium]|nr:PBP1A family penicillin-binding protein [Acidobacteriota bacterium]
MKADASEVETRRSISGILLTALAILAAFILVVLIVYYQRFSFMIDERLSGRVVRSESKVFTAPKRISVGEAVSRDMLVSYLQSAGYSTTPDPEAVGVISLTGSGLDVRPSVNSFFRGKNPLHVDFAGNRIKLLRSLDSGNRLVFADIEPELISELFGRKREKRRWVPYGEIPPFLVKAVLSAEDKRFFDHPGFDAIRVVGAALTDLRRGEKAQGASTITMQVARSFFFSNKREWRRKLKETYMAMILEHRFTKERIFELYANEVYLGNRGSFAIHGFGEASQAYFGEDIRDLHLGQICFLAGIIRAPNRYAYSELRPERAAEARDRVLHSMVANKYITEADAKKAKTMPLRVVSGTFGASFAGHFVDMVKDDLLEKFSETELDSLNYRIYTTLDADLQRAAMDAVDIGLKHVDAQLARRYALWRKRGEEVPLPQVALVALNPHTGEIKALVGGRDYAKSQLNHALSKRQPGSVFKPFVYAAAFETVFDETGPFFVPTTTVVDEPTTFYFDEKEYTPDNYGEEYGGTVTLREALVRSLNIATVKLAEQTGYDRIVTFAKRLGLPDGIKPTPALALGAYELSPLEIAAGYTAFGNFGISCRPVMLQRVITRGGELVQKSALQRKAVLDPRVAYLVTSLLQDVIDRGTGAGVRARGFRAPAAGKTGTSHDGWFAGYTSNLLCVTWVGFDDNRELNLSGAASAGPIWAEFMKRAVRFPAYSNVQQFERPEGVISVLIDPDTLQLACDQCPVAREEVFIAGTEPAEVCRLHGSERGFAPFSWVRRIFRREKPETE